MGFIIGGFWWRIFRFNWFGHQAWFDLAPIVAFAPENGHPLARFAFCSVIATPDTE
jgi:hypothetical protein